MANDPGVVAHLEKRCKPPANLTAGTVVQGKPCRLQTHASALCHDKKLRDLHRATCSRTFWLPVRSETTHSTIAWRDRALSIGHTAGPRMPHSV